jgi:hypothetical protein
MYLYKGKAYRAKSQWQEKYANKSEELNILTQPCRHSTFDNGARCKQL